MPVDVTEDNVRLRQVDPGTFDSKSFRTITISEEKGIKAVVGCPRGKFVGGRCKTGTRVQTYLFSKAKGWDVSKAKTWVSSHKKEEIKAYLKNMPDFILE